jgi:F-type H+-transporting ATPase subunit a
MPKSTMGKVGCIVVVVLLLALCCAGLAMGPIVKQDVGDMAVISMAAEQIVLPWADPFFGTEVPDPAYHAEEGSYSGEATEVPTVRRSTIPNTLPAAWLSMLLLILVAFFAFRRSKLIPSGLQNALETVVEALLRFIEGIVGEEAGRRFLPLVGTFFIYILISNLMGLLPGFGSILVTGLHAGHITKVPLLRSTNADLNTTIALALVSVGATQYFGLRTLRLGYLSKFFNFGRLRQFFAALAGRRPRPKGMELVIDFLLGFVDAFVGILELISEFIKIVSFSFRLFGNIFAGEVLLIVIGFLATFVAPLVFMGLEVFVGFVQALIFSMLSLIFFSTAIAHHGEAAH